MLLVIDIGNTNIVSPGSPRGKSEYEKRKKRKQCKSRAAIEPVIGHMKNDGRPGRNFLKGAAGDAMNALLLCAAGHNLRKILRQLALLCAHFGVDFYRLMIRNTINLKLGW